MPQYPQVMSDARAAKLYGIQVVPHGPTSPPVNIDIPFLSLATGTGVPGDTISCTMGNWDYEPTSYSYRMLRDGVPIAGAPGAANPYTIAAADRGTEITCLVSATNAVGTGTSSPTNAVVIPA